MFKQPIRMNILKQSLLSMVFICVAVFGLAACGSYGSNGPGSPSTATSTPSPAQSPAQSPSAAPFKVTSVDLVVSPNSIAGKVCGSPASFTYTATFHVPAGTAGGTIKFMYTVNNGRSSSSASVMVSPGETTKTYTFSSSGTLSPDHTYPGIAEVLVNSPNTINSPQVKPAGSCTTAAAFEVTGIDMAVSPANIAGYACGTQLTVTYTATFHIAANSPGGTIQFTYTVNNGRGSPTARLTVGAGKTIATYSFTWSGSLPADHTYPGAGGVMTSSPNAVNSPLVKPVGMCS